MHLAFKNKREISQNKELKTKLLKPLWDRFNGPVIVHAVHDKDVFKKILAEGVIKTPSEDVDKKSHYMEKMMGLDKGIFFSVGFVYNVSYHWKYSLIFRKEILKEKIYFKNSVGYQSYKRIFEYWDANDHTLKEIERINDSCKEVVHRYYNEEYNGETKKIVMFWKIENILYEKIMNHPKKEELFNIIETVKQEIQLNYEDAVKDADTLLYDDRVPEIISFKDVDLINNDDFLGFYIEGEIPKDLLNILKEKYEGKIIYDGERVEII